MEGGDEFYDAVAEELKPVIDSCQYRGCLSVLDILICGINNKNPTRCHIPLILSDVSRT